MSDDLLERATKALREEASAQASQDRSALVRARVLSQTKRSAQLRPQNMWQWAAVVCLGFFVSTAMAHVIRVQLPRVIESLRATTPTVQPTVSAKRARPAQPKAAPSTPESHATPAPAPGEQVAEIAAPAHPAPSAEPVAETTAPEVAPAIPIPSAPKQRPEPARPRAAKTSQPRAAVPSVPLEPGVAVREEPDRAPTAAPEIEPVTASAPPPAARVPAAESAELALFRRAQALHLTHDPRAIQAWDAFLRVAGTSALAPEARYNRALGLVRAGRFPEAKRALAPFAEGKYGAYRRQEAQSLLVRLAK